MDKIVYTVVYDTDNFCDGFDMDDYDSAVGSALDVLMTWMLDNTDLEWHPGDDTEPTEEQRDAWNYMIENYEVFIYKHQAGTECQDQDIVWYMNPDDVERIGWKEV